ncbi:MAG: PDZ domain-containing protein [Planctomycetota bacterium]
MHPIAIPLAIALTSSSVLAQSASLTLPARVLRADAFQEPRVDPPGARKSEVGVWLGLSLKARTDGPERLEVLEVFPGSPAERAGARVGDKLVSLGGHPVPNHDAMLGLLNDRHPGERTLLIVERSRKIKLGHAADSEEQALLGVMTTTDANVSKSDDSASTGLRITEMTQGSAAQSAGLVTGERICAVDGLEMESTEQLHTAIQSRQPGDEVELRTQRDLVVELAVRPGDPEGKRKITGSGQDVFGQGDRRLFPVPDKSLGQGLFSPDSKRASPFSVTPPQSEPKPRSKQDKRPEPQMVVPPPRAEGAQDADRKRDPGMARPDEKIYAELLDEVRALRREVADLKRELNQMRPEVIDRLDERDRQRELKKHAKQ